MSTIYDQLKNVIVRESAKSDNMMAQPRYGLVESYNPDKHEVRCSILPERKDDGGKIMTGWLQIASPMVGPHWGIVSPLEIGDQVILLPMYNSGTEYVVLGATFNTQDPVAQGPAKIGDGDHTSTVGQYLICSKSGMTMKFVDDKTLAIKGNREDHEVLHIETKGTDVKIVASDFVNVKCKTALVDASDSITGKAGNTITGQAGSKITLTAPQIEINGEVTINGNTTENGSFAASGNVSDYGSTMGFIREIYDIHVHDDSGPPSPQMPG